MVRERKGREGRFIEREGEEMETRMNELRKKKGGGKGRKGERVRVLSRRMEMVLSFYYI